MRTRAPQSINSLPENKDFESTTAVLRRRAPGFAWLPAVLRRRLTPAALGSALTGLVVTIGYVVSAQHDLRTAQHDIGKLNETVTDLQKQSDLLHKIDTQIAVMNSKIDVIADEVNRQREWRDRIENAAELPPHARRGHDRHRNTAD